MAMVSLHVPIHGSTRITGDHQWKVSLAIGHSFHGNGVLTCTNVMVALDSLESLETTNSMMSFKVSEEGKTLLRTRPLGSRTWTEQVACAGATAGGVEVV